MEPAPEEPEIAETSTPAQSDLLEFTAEPGVIQIIMDERERNSDLKMLLEKLGAQVRMRTLNVGDFILSDRIVVERKTRADFESSIIDGRMFRQAASMSQFPKPMMIIEGEAFEGRINRNAMLGAISSLMLDHSIQIFFTLDQGRTAELLFALAKREQASESRPVRMKGDKRATTMAQQQQMIIECLPNVGPLFAQALLAKFGTVEKVMRATEKQLLAVKRMGPKRAKLIRKVLSDQWKGSDDGNV
jgi:Fanconi anemia group M protein